MFPSAQYIAMVFQKWWKLLHMYMYVSYSDIFPVLGNLQQMFIKVLKLSGKSA